MNLFKIKKTTFKHGSILLIATGAGGVCNYLFNILIGRMLAPAEYASVVALFSALAIITFPYSAIQTVIARYTAGFNAKSETGKIKQIIVKASKTFIIVTVVLFFIIAALSVPLSRFLNISSPISIVLIGSVLLLMTPLALNRGVLNGLQHYFRLSVNGTAEVLTKLLVGVVFVYLGFGVNGAVLAVVLGTLVGLVISTYQLKPIFAEHAKEGVQKIVISEVYRYGLAVLVNILIFNILTNSTMLIVKHRYSSDIAGHYAGAEIISKILLFVTGIIPVMLLPKVAVLESEKKDARAMLLKGLVPVFAIGIVFIVGCLIYGKQIITFFFGSKYADGGSLLWSLSIALFFYSIYNVASYYLIAAKKNAFLYFAAAILLFQITAASLFSSNLNNMVVVLIGSGFMLVVMTLFLSFREKT